jgi:protein SCO1
MQRDSDTGRTGNDFIHSATLIVVSPERKISRYLNGTYFLPFEVKMAVLEASEGRVGPTSTRSSSFVIHMILQGRPMCLILPR